ncbi:MAG: class I SAM-dependent methyltransferase [Candidatus Micrarchaeota archaeon]|nr:class I SAM-dependent methyltransferase [Candidatus Micrarchaeota archaeon]MDE1834841.1 class I SAM-dependent methyltransferase [Candidatus Micrarchaeota archaeon]MDE1858916.1 class I SAM-dependent methyltransferase [Candidatus Micrarchaeota archaeon]
MAAKRKILEIGHGGTPLGMDFRKFVEVVPSHIEYHGIDSCFITPRAAIEPFRMPTALEERIFEAEKFHYELKPDNVELYRMDGKRIMFPSSTFDEIHMHYLLSDPILRHANGDSIPQILRETKRVLKDDGVLIVSDLRLPYLFDEEPQETFIPRMLEAAGFSVTYDEGELKKATAFYGFIEGNTKVIALLQGDINDRLMLLARKE